MIYSGNIGEVLDKKRLPLQYLCLREEHAKQYVRFSRLASSIN